ncbi:YopX family protein [Lactiplantibacillus plantarum]|uniref:YopX family protein n=1 Tax=Lactiplantibacillus plantarum TaxID=1590 RepID=UPI0032DF18EC
MIKFRGIPLEDVSEMRCVNFDGDFVYGYYIKNGDGALIVGDKTKELDDVGLSRWFANVVPETVGQFTGLKDVNGKDIYEGDVLENRKYRSIVKFASGKFLADVVGTISRFDLIGETHGSKVIGNVHANPELLEEKK